MKYYKQGIGLFTVFLLLAGCDRIPFLTQAEDYTQINISLETQHASPGLAKTQFIESARLTVSGSDITTITKSLTVNKNITPWRIEGEVEVKKGDNRKFEIEGLDANAGRLFYGSTTVNIDKGKMDLTIPISWDPVMLFNDDNSFEDYRYSEVDGLGLAVKFDSPIYPLELQEVYLYLRGTFVFDIDILNADGTFNDYADSRLVNSQDWAWFSYDISDLNLTLDQGFYISVYYKDNVPNSNIYGPYLGLDTDSNGGSYFVSGYSSDEIASYSDGQFGIRVIVQYEGTAKVLKPTTVKSMPFTERPLQELQNINSPISSNLLYGTLMKNLIPQTEKSFIR